MVKWNFWTTVISKRLCTFIRCTYAPHLATVSIFCETLSCMTKSLWKTVVQSQYKTRNQFRSQHTIDLLRQPDTLCKSELIYIMIYYSYRIWSPFELSECQSQRGRGCTEKSANGLTQQKSRSQLWVSAKPSASCLLTKTYAHNKTHLKHSSGTLTALYSNLLQSSGSPPHRPGRGQDWDLVLPPILGQPGMTQYRFQFLR